MERQTAARELLVRGQTPADVLARVREGLEHRGRWVDPRSQDGIEFRGGWALAWRTSSKPIRGVVHAVDEPDGTRVRIFIRDAAISGQVVRLGFEHRQYETVIDHELDAIQQDAERGHIDRAVEP
jgi:hypothetical protein